VPLQKSKFFKQSNFEYSDEGEEENSSDQGSVTGSKTLNNDLGIVKDKVSSKNKNKASVNLASNKKGNLQSLIAYKFKNTLDGFSNCNSIRKGNHSEIEAIN